LYHVALRKKKLIAQCEDGDVVAYTIQTVDRNNGKRGIEGVELEVVRKASASMSR
jgi:hypothetical protein